MHHHRENGKPSDIDDDHWYGRVYSAGYRRSPVRAVMFLFFMFFYFFLEILFFGCDLVCSASGFMYGMMIPSQWLINTVKLTI